MMRAFILWYSKNRKKIWRTIGIVVGALIAVRLFQYAWEQSRLASNEVVDNTDVSEILGTLNTITVQEDKSVISGENITKGQADLLTTLDTFVQYCNEGKINEAYNLLSDDCKAQMYTNVEDFKTRYYNHVFSSGKKEVSAENWNGNIYKVTFINDILSTGVYNKSDTIQDYITLIVDKEGNTKLNINNYIGRKEIDEESEKDNVKIKAIEKNIYLDYEIYKFEVKNNSNQTILLANMDSMNDMYLLDNNNSIYKAYINELTEESLKIESNETKTITVKYYNSYISSRRIEKIVFANIKLNYNTYANNSSYAKIEIDL